MISVDINEAKLLRQMAKSRPLRLEAKDGQMTFEVVEVDTVPGHRKMPPAVVLNDPIYARNVSGALRACAAWGIDQLWWTGDRITAEISGMSRLPREERLKGYNKVQLFWHDRPLDYFVPEAVPVCVELVPGAIPIQHFTHPELAVYVFGPENGSVGRAYRGLCHHFIKLPTAHCINLAAAVNVVLAHRRLQRLADGREEDRGDWLDEKRGPMISMSEEG